MLFELKMYQNILLFLSLSQEVFVVLNDKIIFNILKKNDKQKITYFICIFCNHMATSNAASDPLYHDVSPEYERYTRLFLIFSGLICIISIICAIVKAQDE